MSRRRPPAELQFGSDSFLDVVANLVGILIILIVIAGLRVSQMPVAPKSVEKAKSTEVESIPLISSAPELPKPTNPVDIPQIAVLPPMEEHVEEPEAEPEAEPEPPPLPPLPPLVVPREMVIATTRLESEIATLQKEQVSVVERLKSSDEQQSTLLERQQTIQNLLTEKKQELDVSRKKVAVVEADLDLARETLVRLTKQVSQLENQPPHIETLEHKVTPLSRIVHGKEKHYRLEKNRVAEVPIDELVTRFREQIDRRKDWLVKTRQHQGLIGPIRGFSMQYLVRIESMSDLDAAKMGHGGFRISLAQWEIVAEADAKGESEEVALRKGSQFYQSILGASPDITLTFWVYPDSYALYRKLQKFTQEHGFSVAARPLPRGVPIAGSPNGSKSASQ